MEIIRIENLTFYYPGSDIPAIDHFSVSIDSGDFFVLLDIPDAENQPYCVI